ncbi:hypothetical protein GOP47_0028055 [Adiantum capillus-veneris]|nr:hypothetical protein GOP47_0028055 [Adiantum capillus-veneris]
MFQKDGGSNAQNSVGGLSNVVGNVCIYEMAPYADEKAVSMASMQVQRVVGVVLMGCMMMLMVMMSCEAEFDAQKCENDAQFLVDECNTDDATRCCTAFNNILAGDSACVCKAVSAGALDPNLISEGARQCNSSVPSSVSSCLGTSGGSNNTGSTWISLLVVLLLSLAISINT